MLFSFIFEREIRPINNHCYIIFELWLGKCEKYSAAYYIIPSLPFSDKYFCLCNTRIPQIKS